MADLDAKIAVAKEALRNAERDFDRAETRLEEACQTLHTLEEERRALEEKDAAPQRRES